MELGVGCGVCGVCMCVWDVVWGGCMEYVWGMLGDHSGNVDDSS